MDSTSSPHVPARDALLLTVPAAPPLAALRGLS